MKTTLTKATLIAITLVLANLFFVNSVFGQTTGDYRTVLNTTWTTLTTWQRFNGVGWATPTAGEGYPGQFTVPALVTIRNGNTNSLNVSPVTIGALTIESGNLNSTLTFAGANSLIVNGAVTIGVGVNPSAADKTIAVAAGNLSCASVTMTDSGADTRVSSLTVSTGTITVTGDVTMDPVPLRNFVRISNSGTLNVSGALTGGDLQTVNVNSTVNYNGANQTVRGVNYAGFLSLSGTGTKTLLTTTTLIGRDLTLSGTATSTTVVGLAITRNLIIGNGTLFTADAFDLTVTGTTTVGGGTSGQLSISSATGTKQFTGLVTIANGGTWDNSTANSPVNFRGGINNNATGTFTAGTGVHTFTNTNQALTGTIAIPSVTVTGINLTNNNSLTVSTDLSGTGNLIQAVNASLDLGGTASITTLTATNIGNTVNYSGAAQTVKIASYRNLTLSGSGDKTMTGVTTISGNLSLNGSATATTGADLAVGGNVSLIGTSALTTGVGFNFTVTGGLDIGNGTNVTVNGNNFIVTGATTVGGTTSGTLTITTGANIKRFTGTLTVAAGGTYTNTGNSPVNMRGGITNNGTVTSFAAGTGLYTFDTNSQQLLGTLAIPNVTVTGALIDLTNNNSLTVSTALSGTGSLTQEANSSLDLGGTAGITTLNANIPGNTNIVTYSGAAQTVKATSYFNLTLSGSGAKTMTGVSVIDGDFVLSGTATSTAAAALTISGSVTLGSGTSFTAGAFTHNLSGGWFNNGAIFNNAGSTINFNGNPQSIGGSISTTFNNVTLSNAGTKTFAIATFIDGNFLINAPAIADLSNIINHTANILTLDGVNQAAGVYGSSSSSAPIPNQNDTYFLPASTGIITIASQVPVAYFSRANGDWNLTTTWSTVGFGSPVNAGTFPVAGDIVNIGGGFTVTVNNANAACTSLIFTAAAASNTININSSFTLAVSGVVTIAAANNPQVNTINVGPGTMTAGSINFSVAAPRALIAISTGTVTVAGNIIGTQGSIVFSGAGLLQLGGAGVNSIYTPANGTLTTVAGSIVEYNGAAQTVRSHTYNGTLLLSGSGAKTLPGALAAIPGNFTLSGTATASAVIGMTIGGNLTLESGSTFIAGTFTHNVAGNWINNGGTFTNDGSTINLNRNGIQSIGGTTSTTFNNLTLAGNNTKTFILDTDITGTLSIPNPVPAIADLGTGLNHTAGTLILGGVIQVPSTYGSTGAPLAATQTDVYFAAASNGIVTVAGETFYSRLIGGNWNDNNTWSFTPGGAAVGAGIFPGVDDIVFIQGNAATVTVNVNAFCGSLKFTNGAAFNRLVTINPGITLDVSGAITIPRANAGFSNTLAVGDGILNAGSIAYTVGGGAGIRHQITINNGTVTVTGDITTNSVGASALISFTGTGTLNAGGGLLTAPVGGTLTTILGSTINYNGPLAQTVKVVTYNGNLTLSGGGAKTMTGVTTIGGTFTVSGTATATPAALNIAGNFILGGTALVAPTAALTITGGVTLGTGTTFTAGAFTHNVAGDWTNNGAIFDNTGNTINFNRNGIQSIGGTSTTTFNNVTLAGNNNKTFGVITAIDGNFSIPGPAKADLGASPLNHTAGTLILGGVNQAAGTYGSTISTAPPANQNDTYFANTGTVTVASAGFFSRQTGPWNDVNTWSYTTPGGAPAGVIPGAGANVSIVGGFNVTVNVPSTCATLTFGAAGVSNTVTITSTLNVTGAITIPRTTANGPTNTLAVGAGTLDAGSIKFTNGGGGGGLRHQMTISSGTVTVTGDITTDILNAQATINITGTGTINAGVGIFTTAPAGGTFTTAANSTVNYEGGAQTVKNINYLGNLTLDGSGIKTFQAGTTQIGGTLTLSGSATTTTVVGLTISGNLNIGDGTAFTAAGFPLTVGGTTTVGGGTSGQLSISSATGVKRFTGLVSIANNAIWNNSTANSPVFFGGGITYSGTGTFNAGSGLHTFDNTSQALTGTLTIPNVAVTGVTVTNNGNLTVATALSGTGGLTQAASATLNIGGTSGITTLTASNAGNTVNYNGTTNQSVKTPVGSQYANLSFNGTTAAGFATAPASTLLVNGNWANSGTGTTGTFIGFNPNGGTIEFNGTSTISGSTTTSFNNLTITGSLTSSSATINVGGGFINNGTFNSNNGTVNFNGATQSISGSAITTGFNNVTISNTSGTVSLDANADLTGTLSLPLASSSFDADGAGSVVLTLLSTSATQAGSIGFIATPDNFSGNVTVQRHMGTAIPNVNRYISMPVTGMVLDTDLSELGLSSGGFIYNEGLAGPQNIGWQQTSSSYALQSGLGFVTYDSPASWDVRGPLTLNSNQGDVSLPVSFTSTSGGPSADGWNLIGNPYPSAIHWSNNASEWSISGIDPVVYVPDLLSNTFIPFNHTDNSGAGGIIAMGQAFWIHATGAPSLTIKEAAKTSTGTATFYRKAERSSSEQLVIGIQNERFRDNSYLKINPKATDDYDQPYDGYKLMNKSLNIYLKDDADRSLVMHTLSTIPYDKTIPLVIEAAEPGEYSISFSNMENFALASSLYLIDKWEGKAVAVTSGETYSLQTTRSSQKIDNRFYLSRNPQIPERKFSDFVQVYPNPVKDKLTIELPGQERVMIRLTDNQGREMVAQQIKGSYQIDMSSYPQGMYVLRLVTEGEVIVKKIIR